MIASTLLPAASAPTTYLDGEPTIDQVLFDAALRAGSEGDLEDAVAHWRTCWRAGT